MDVAATEFFDNGSYKFEGKQLTSDQMITYYSELVSAYPLVSIEDPLDEDDWEGWAKLTASMVSVRVPIWFTLTSKALAVLLSIPRNSRSGLVTNRSSPTI